MRTILIVDDEADIREMLGQLFTLEGYLVYTAGNGREALGQLGDAGKRADAGFDAILLDVNMPECDGYELCRRIREFVDCPILFLTARVAEEDKVMGFRAGGDDYIEKPFSTVELRERVAAHIRRQQRAGKSGSVGFAGGFTISYSGRQVLYGGQNVPLTKTEFEIVEFLSRNPNRTFTKEMIYEHLWGFDKEGESSIITEHIRRIRGKLRNFSEEELIETVWGVGYRWSNVQSMWGRSNGSD